MRTMAFVSVLLFITGIGIAAGDTVMIHIVEKNYLPTDENGARSYASALEAGIMDALFERGHIAFSSGMSGSPDPGVLLRTAEAGGAEVVLEAQLFCRTVPGGRQLVPTEVTYVMSSVGGGDPVTRGRIAAQGGGSGDLQGDALCFDLGLRVADRIAVHF